MSEDHKLSVLRERIRCKSKTPVEFRPLPADASAIFLPEFCRPAAPAGFVPMQSLHHSMRPTDSTTAAERERPVARTSSGGLARLSDHDVSSHGTPAAADNPPSARGSRAGSASGTPWSVPTTPEVSIHGRSTSTRRSFDGSSSSAHVGLSLAAAQLSLNSNNSSVSGKSMNGNSSAHGSLSRHGSRQGSRHGGPMPRSGVAALADAVISPQLSMHGSHAGIVQQPVEDLSRYQFIFDWGYPAEGTEGAARALIQAVSQYAPEASPRAHEYADADDGMSAISAPNKESFISQRISTDGESAGPEALFSKFNNSILMTRSIGDLYGPRSCVCVPEISACSVPDNAHARFVLASDGAWDVVSIEDIRCVAMSEKMREPQVRHVTS
jgi:hypothetical protein